MGKYRELLSLTQEIIENETTVSIQELGERAHEYYCAGDITPTQYDHIISLIDNL